VPDRPARKLVGVYMPYEDWEKLALLAYVRQLKNSASGRRGLTDTKSRIMVEAFEEYLRNHPELEKEIRQARQAFHIEEGGKA